MDNDLREKLEAYVAELQHTIKRIEESEFPFSDVVLIYGEVIEHLKEILK